MGGEEKGGQRLAHVALAAFTQFKTTVARTMLYANSDLPRTQLDPILPLADFEIVQSFLSPLLLLFRTHLGLYFSTSHAHAVFAARFRLRRRRWWLVRSLICRK